MIQAYFDQIEALVSKYAVTRFVLDVRISRELLAKSQKPLPRVLKACWLKSLWPKGGCKGTRECEASVCWR